jgi:hypothetical protein
MITLWHPTRNYSIPFSWCCQLQHGSSFNKQVMTKTSLIPVFFTYYRANTVRSAIMRVSLTRIGYNVIDEKGDSCLYKAKFRIRVLAVRRFLRPVWICKFGWRAKYFLIWPYFYCAVFSKRGLTITQNWLYSKTATFMTCIRELSGSNLVRNRSTLRFSWFPWVIKPRTLKFVIH